MSVPCLRPLETHGANSSVSLSSFGSKVRRRFVPPRPARVQLNNRRSFKIVFVSSHLKTSLCTLVVCPLSDEPLVCLLYLSITDSGLPCVLTRVGICLRFTTYGRARGALERRPARLQGGWAHYRASGTMRYLLCD